MRSSDGEGRSIRSDALYPALSGEWEVPVTRNAKITPVNEGGGGRGRGASEVFSDSLDMVLDAVQHPLEVGGVVGSAAVIVIDHLLVLIITQARRPAFGP